MAYKDRLRNKANAAYHNMMKRCHNPRAAGYARYGGRGITVCDRWRDGGWLVFLEDVGLPPDASYSLDRIDPFGPYSPENVRWADDATQRANTRISAACKRGHLRTEENSRWYTKNGKRYRQCRPCLRASTNRWLKGYRRRLKDARA